MKSVSQNTLAKSVVAGSEAGLVDEKLLVQKDQQDGGEGEAAGGGRSTVDQFLDEEPPQLKHNQKCVEHPDEFVVAYNKLSYEYLCGRCVSG